MLETSIIIIFNLNITSDTHPHPLIVKFSLGFISLVVVLAIIIIDFKLTHFKPHLTIHHLIIFHTGRLNFLGWHFSFLS